MRGGEEEEEGSVDVDATGGDGNSKVTWSSKFVIVVSTSCVC
jgi:anthranilate phosphoribosyltransferase